MRKVTLLVWMLIAGVASAQQVDLKSLDKIASKATSKTEINLDESMVKSASSLLGGQTKDEVVLRTSASGIKGLYLRAYEFEDKNAYKMDDLKSLLDQLKAPDWVLFLKSEEGDEHTEIWMHRTRNEPDGMLLIAAESNELTVINAPGLSRLEDLGSLGNLGNLAAAQAKSGQSNGQAPPKNDD